MVGKAQTKKLEETYREKAAAFSLLILTASIGMAPTSKVVPDFDNAVYSVSAKSLTAIANGELADIAIDGEN